MTEKNGILTFECDKDKNGEERHENAFYITDIQTL